MDRLYGAPSSERFHFDLDSAVRESADFRSEGETFLIEEWSTRSAFSAPVAEWIAESIAETATEAGGISEDLYLEVGKDPIVLQSIERAIERARLIVDSRYRECDRLLATHTYLTPPANAEDQSPIQITTVTP